MERIGCAVMSVPGREASLQRTVESLTAEPGPLVFLATDTFRSGPWSTLRRCLKQHDGYDHLVVVQDDAVAVPGFWTAVERIIAMRPDALVSLYMGSETVARQAVSKGAAWAMSYGAFHTVAAIYPSSLIPGLLAWASEYIPSDYVHDDGVIGLYCHFNRIETWSVVHSLVEHGDEPSTMRHFNKDNPAAKGHRAASLETHAATRDYGTMAVKLPYRMGRATKKLADDIAGREATAITVKGITG